MAKRLTKEEFELLTPFEKNMITAAKADYSRAIQSKDAEAMKAIYERLTDDKSINLTCSKCVLKMLKKLYDYYVAKQEELAKKATKETE